MIKKELELRLLEIEKKIDNIINPPRKVSCKKCEHMENSENGRYCEIHGSLGHYDSYDLNNGECSDYESLIGTREDKIKALDIIHELTSSQMALFGEIPEKYEVTKDLMKKIILLSRKNGREANND